jgi:hypothetical protein
MPNSITNPQHERGNEISVLSAAEEVIPIRNSGEDMDKGGIVIIEDTLDEKAGDLEDPNSPWSILQRYPLLRNKSEGELDILNRRVRRRM